MAKLTLNSDLSQLERIPSSTIKKLKEAHIHTVENLLWVIPLHWDLVPETAQFGCAQEGEYFKGQGQVIDIRSHPSRQRGAGRSRLYNISLEVQDCHSPATMTLRWPNAYPQLKNKIEQSTTLHFYGKVRRYRNQLGLIHPTLATDSNHDYLKLQYPTINGLHSWKLKNLLHKILPSLWQLLDDPVPEAQRYKLNMCHLQDAFKIIHGQVAKPQLLRPEHLAMAKKRLIYQEFYLEQVKIDIRRTNNRHQQAPALKISPPTLKKIISHFPYPLTDDQSQAIQDIAQDLQSPVPMMRMLQGDVGCGKTTVAFVAALIAALNDHQAAMMCPTETLATQHYHNACKLFESFDFNCGLLLGSHTPSQKQALLQQIAAGEVAFVLGTHALFQDQVKFARLALSIVDEQHKFGVGQRLRLSGKSNDGHTLIMTATPIPRSLSLTHYGDLDISSIKHLPANRRGIRTRIVTPQLFAKFLAFIKTRIEMGEQAYIVAPAIEDNPEHDFIAAKKVFARFEQFFPEYSLGLLHGKLDSTQKQTVFQKFRQGQTQLLIATSIIEVGVDVPNASIMGIINPERFGLSSLHQLRGRVGRGGNMGFCFLVTESQSPETLQRLQVIERTTDGFKVAEADLALRGEGDLFGIHQSGRVARKLANVIRDQELLWQVKEDFPRLKSSPLYRQDYQRLSQELPIVLTI